MMNKKILWAFVIAWCFSSNAFAQQRLLGGDISLLPTYQQRGTQYLTRDGRAMPLLQMVRDEGGWNCIRVRLFVEPQNAPGSHKDEGVCQDLPYVIGLCRQVKEAGMKLMLDFHYSDTWADPGKQFTPRRWLDLQPQAMADSVYAYTTAALKALKQQGISPELIQVGNEITFGMLWPSGKVEPTKDDNWDVLSSYLKSGVRACREQCPDAQIIIHTEHAQDWIATRGYYERLQRYGVDYDVIGLSYYPMWHGTISHLGTVLDSLAIDFPDKPVMIVETAYYYSHENNPWVTDPQQHSELYPITPEGQAQFTRELTFALRNRRNVTGLFWWFPEENASGQKVIGGWLNRGLFDNHTGRALPAFYDFRF